MGRGVDTELFSPNRRDTALRHQWGVDDSVPVAIFVGRLAPEKGHDTLISAWALLREKVPHAHLAIAGHGSTEGDLQDLITKHKLQDRVHLLGFRNDIPALYAQADAAALAPTAGESFGIALLEAYAAGKACVATDVGGVRDLVVDGETGFLCSEADAMAGRLQRLVTDPDLRAQLASAAQAEARAQFTVQAMARKTLALYETLPVKARPA